MATKSVATKRSEIVSQPSWIYTESDPYERATARLNGIRALQPVVDCAMESNSVPTARVWSDLWFFIATVTEDVKRDMYELSQSSARKEAQS